ncbi:MAG: hypothetical protein QGF29_12130, partial [Verrucomicrobiota bacterium]|nr:hypothetical protein [Verrucomicrobiota bacterium]
LHIDFALLSKFHPAIYRSVSTTLKMWFATASASSGIASIARARERIGREMQLTELVERAPTFENADCCPLQRFRPPRRNETGLPTTIYPVLREFWMQEQQTWLVWSEGQFWAEETCLTWRPLPRSASGAFMPLGWSPECESEQGDA